MLKKIALAVVKSTAKVGGTNVARGIMSGFVQQHAAKWTIEEIRQWAEEGRGVAYLVPEEYWEPLREQGRNFPALKDLTLQEFLGWVEKGNPELFDEMLTDPNIMRWLSSGWEPARTVYFGPG